MEDNISLQKDEIESLTAIYDSQWQIDSEIANSFTFRVNRDIQLFLTLKSDYPSHGPPVYELFAPSISPELRSNINNEFKRIFEENQGMPIIFQWIDKLQELVQSNSEDPIELNHKECHVEEKCNSQEHLDLNIIHGATIEDRKSVFQGHACIVNTEEDVKSFVNILKQNRKIAQATHNILAYRIQKLNIIHQDYDDDGETHAGQRLLHLLQILNTTNVAVVVSRWYGGIHLGPKRFQHINNAARQVLEKAKFI